jgi:hypothetical protein
MVSIFRTTDWDKHFKYPSRWATGGPTTSACWNQHPM